MKICTREMYGMFSFLGVDWNCEAVGQVWGSEGSRVAFWVRLIRS